MIRHIELQPLKNISIFRKIAAASWSAPSDPTVYGDIEIDMTPALQFLERLRKDSNARVTVTHLVGRAVAQVLAEEPSANVIIRWSKFYQRKDVDIFFHVSMEVERPGLPPDLSGVVIRRADRKSVIVIAQELQEKAESVRMDKDRELASSRQRFGTIPSILLRPLLRFFTWAQYSFNIHLPGMPRDPFGSAMVTNVGMFGISHAFSPLFPMSRCPLVVLVGALSRKAWVVNDSGVERLDIRPVLPISVAFDHRIMDGVQAGKMMRRFIELMADPDNL